MVRVSRYSIVACGLTGFCAPVTSLSVPPNDIAKATIITTTSDTTTSGRRAFFRKVPFVAAALVTTTVHGTAAVLGDHHQVSCHCDSCTTTTATTTGWWQPVQPVMAFERRDVGGDKPSGEMQAMNIQAYETMSRLEKSGVKLETQEEQRASLTSALSEYSYQPTTTGGKKINDSKKSQFDTKK